MRSVLTWFAFVLILVCSGGTRIFAGGRVVCGRVRVCEFAGGILPDRMYIAGIRAQRRVTRGNSAGEFNAS